MKNNMKVFLIMPLAENGRKDDAGEYSSVSLLLDGVESTLVAEKGRLLEENRLLKELPRTADIYSLIISLRNLEA